MAGKKKQNAVSYTDFYKKNNKLLTRYGITKEFYDSILEKQRGKCAICKKPQLGLSKSLCVDHCHQTGKIRGLLCNHCNIALGKFDDNLNLLLEAKKYLFNYPLKNKSYLTIFIKKKGEKMTTRDKVLRKTRKISLENYNKILDLQDKKCAICKNESGYKCGKKGLPKPLSVDHNHFTNIIRGLLCDNCNSGIGLFKDDEKLFKKAIKYIKENAV